jgi:D-glycero-D-manno-heptose 1,7-bisphosphate phosphatase
VLEALARATAAGHRIVIVTNQANLRRGLLTPAMLADIHRRMLAAVMAAGGEVEHVYVCGHGPEDGCDCRKPASGLLLTAATDLGFDLDSAYVVGDHASDMAAANAVGATSVLVRSGRGSVAECSNGSTPAFVAEDLAAAIDLVLRSEVRLDGARAAVAARATA